MAFRVSSSGANSGRLRTLRASTAGSNPQFQGSPSSGTALFPSRYARRRSLNCNVRRQVAMSEITREWRPIKPPFPGTLRVINLLDGLDHDGLVLYLGEVAEANFAIRFGDVLAYRRSSSSVFIRTWRREIRTVYLRAISGNRGRMTPNAIHRSAKRQRCLGAVMLHKPAAAHARVSMPSSGSWPCAPGPTLIGTVKLNVEPLPSSLSTQILPPCISTNFRASVSPRPVPSGLPA